jgi:sec-independent protein translocase protein TatB
MFDISFWELIVVGVIALLVVGPEKLPLLVRDISKWARKIRRIVTETRYELEREFDFEEERRKLTNNFNDEKKDLRSAIDELDELMEIAPDRDPDNKKQDLPG